MADHAGGLVPAGILFGAVVTATAEGGFNGPGQPENQWWSWERTGRVPPAGLGADVWEHPEAALDRAAGAGCEVLVLPLEWARVEPSPDGVDTDALARYARTMAGCAERGMVPVATLHDLAHPEWLGAEFWLTPGSPDRFARHAARVAQALGGACRDWVTVLRPNLAALAGWVGGHVPPGRVLAASDAWAVLDNLCTAHVLAYDAIHRLQDDAVVSMGLSAPGPYDWHRLPADLMAAPVRGVDRRDVDSWVDSLRRAHDAELVPASMADLATRRLAAALSPYGRAGPGPAGRLRGRQARATPRRLLDVVYDRPATAPMDGLAIVWSPGSSARAARPDLAARTSPTSSTARTARTARTAPWDAPADIDGLVEWCRALASAGGGVPVWIQASLPMPPGCGARPDGWDRPSYLRALVAATVDAARAGTPVAGLCYRDLGGPAEPGRAGAATGLFAVTPEPGAGVAWQLVDSSGAASGEAFGRLVAQVRSGVRLAPPQRT